MSAEDALVGTLIADRYRVVRKLGEGGMGVVYQAVHEALRKPVALKLLSTGGRIDREAVARFEREAVAAANLRHPNIAEATDFGKLPDGAFYLVMEYVEGTTLRRVIHDQGALPPQRALGILLQVGSALATAHARDVVHRDLKPENVIVTSAPGNLATPPASPLSAPGSTDFVKVIDFGIAKIRNATFGIGGGAATAALTRAGMVFGTPEYMAPEQVMGQAVDARADQYALGVLAFELLTGKPPFSAEDTGQLMMMHVGAPVPSTRDRTPTLPAAADAVVMKMLAKLPDERFESVAEAMTALASALGAGPSSAAGAGAGAATPGSVPVTASGPVAAISGEAISPGTPSIREAQSPVTGNPTVKLGRPPMPSQGTIVQATTPQTLRSMAMEAPPAQAVTGPPGREPMPLPPVPPNTAGTRLLHTRAPGASGSGARKLPKWIFAVGAGSLLAGVLLIVLIVRSCGGNASLPPEVAAALGDWKGGKIAPAAAVLRTAIADEPDLAQDVVLARTLAESVSSEPARRALAGLLETTPLGRSTPMASALADQAMKDDPSVRDPALDLLRERLDLLNEEQNARVRLRDAEECDELEAAKADLGKVTSQATQRDLERLPREDCKRMLREKALCDRCKAGGGPPPGKGLGNMGGPKGKGKKDKKR